MDMAGRDLRVYPVLPFELDTEYGVRSTYESASTLLATLCFFFWMYLINHRKHWPIFKDVILRTSYMVLAPEDYIDQKAKAT